jgi:hypothetical protein
MEVYADNLLRFSHEPHLWTTRLEFEAGQTLQSRIQEDQEPGTLLQNPIQSIQADRLYLNSIYTYHLLSWAGPYARVAGETSLFEHSTEFASPTIVEVQDDHGTPIDYLYGADGNGVYRIHLANPFSPTELKQGTGVNFRLLHNTILDLDLRTGIGSRQYLTRGEQLLVATTPSSGGPRGADGRLVAGYAVKAVSDSVVAGPEAAVLASARLTRYVQATTELDALVPFSGFSETQYTWRSSVSLRLSTYASLVYTLNLDRHPNVRPDQPLATEQGLQLRFAYTPF